MLKVEGLVGESINLNCSFNISEVINVHLRNGNKLVYDIINGTEKARPEYKERVTSLLSQYKNGRFSINIEHLQISDEGVSLYFITGSSQHNAVIEVSVKGE